MYRSGTRSGRPASLPAAALVVLAALFGGNAAADPFLPGDDATILERLPTAKDAAIAELRRGHASLARLPGNLNLAVAVARRDVAEARARFDPRFNGYAQAALAPWWTMPDPPAPVRLLRAVIHQSNHDFAASLLDLDALLQADPANPQALLTRAVVHQVRGEYGAARADCASVGKAGAELAATICTQGVRGLGPELDSAFHDLAQVDEAAEGEITRELQLWALTLLAEMAGRMGDAPVAGQYYARALAIDPHDGYLRGAFADFLLDQDRPREVVDLLADATRIDPLLLRLAIAERRLGLPAAPGHVAELADRFAASTARGESVHAREQARFTLELLGQPEPALALALANWQVQREPADARILLECAAAARRPDAAQATMQWLAATGLADPRLQRLAERLRHGGDS